MAAQRPGFLGNKKQRRQQSDKLNSYHEDKFATKTRYEPDPGSFFPRFLWGVGLRDRGNKVGIGIALEIQA